MNELAFQLRSYSGKNWLNYSDSSLVLSRKIGYKAGIARAMNVSSMRFISDAHYDSIININLDALELAKEVDHDFALGKIYNTLAYCHYKKLEHDKSLEYYRLSLDHAEDERTRGTVLGNLVRLHTDYKNYEIAEKYLEELHNLYEGNEDPNKKYVVNFRYGTLYLYTEKWDLAANYFEKALANAKELKQNAKRKSLNLFLAEVYIKSGKFELGNRHLHKVDELGLIQKHGLTTKVRLKYWQSMSAFNSGNYNLAYLIASEGMAIAQEKKSKRYILLYKEHLVNCEEALGNYKSAFLHMKELKVKKDSISSEERSRKILELETKYQAEKKDITNQLLVEQAERNTAELRQRRTLNIAGGLTGILSSFLALLYWRYFRREKEYSENLEIKVKERTRKLEKSNEELERFAYITSHDLTEPIRNIRNFSQLIRAKSIERVSEVESYFDIIDHSTDQMQSLVDGILDYSKLNSLDDQKKTKLNQVLNDVTASISNTLTQRNAIIEIGELPTIRCNSIQIFQVFKNMIENALKYNRSLKPTISIYSTEDNEYHKILIKDNGIGIDPAFKDTIFEMFSRLHNRATYKGAGLGLSIVQKIMKDLNGKVSLIESSKDGSTFALYFPLIR